MLSLPTDKIVVLDGAFGTMAQSLRLCASDFTIDGIRAPGCVEALCLTRPDAVKSIHLRYLHAGADIITTNSFCANAVSLSDHGLAHRSADIALAAASIARSAADGFCRATGRQCLVAGSVGPTRHSLSAAPDGIDFDALLRAYSEQASAMIAGGADLILIETVFDTVNAQAAIDAVRGQAPGFPIVISATIPDTTGRLLSGHDAEAFCAWAMEASPVAVCLNCGILHDSQLPYLRAIAKCAPCLVGYYPSAGLPDAGGTWPRTPEKMAAEMSALFAEGLLNIAGGCCGTTPAHIQAIAAAAHRYPPRPLRQKHLY